MLSQDLQVSIGTAIIVSAAALVLSAAGAAAWASTGSRRGLRPFAEAFRDPALASAIGLTVTFALIPLAWFHYYVLILLPAVWLVAKPDHSAMVRVAGALAIVLAAGGIQPVVGPLFGWTGVHFYATALSWLPVWVGVLALLVRRRSPEGAPEIRRRDR